MRAVNLLPRPEAKSRKLRPTGAVLLAACAPVVAGGLIAGAYAMSSGSVSTKEQTLAGLESELAALPAPTPIDPTSVALSRETDERIVSVGAALSERMAVDRILREISLVLPEDVWLSGLTIRSDSAEAGGSEPEAAPAAEEDASAGEGEGSEADAEAQPPSVPEAEATSESSGFVLVGYTYSQEGVARMLSRLAVLPHLANVQLSESLSVPAGKRFVVQFTILADLRTPNGSS
jgi:Tfp pilus assembly protein PilN